MFTSDLKTAFRSILRNKVTSAICILGLGIGLGCLIVLLALIVHEKSFDRHIPAHNNIYRIILGTSSQTHYPLAEEMAREFPEVKDFFRYYQAAAIQLKTKGNEILREQGFAFSDTSVYSILGTKLLSGVPAASQSEVAISDLAAKKYYGDISPVGEILPVKFTDGFTELTVTGVFKSFPSSSTLNPSFIADIRLSEKVFAQFQRALGDFGNDSISSLDWRYTEFTSYVVLDENADPDALQGKMEKYKEFISNQNKDELHYRLQPVSEIYLGSEGIAGGFFLRRGNREELKYFEAICILILFISLANFIFLARAGFSERVHELGTRKVFGASNRKIRRLIIIESNLVVILSLIPASFVIDFGIEFINRTLNKTLSAEVFLNPWLWLLLICTILLTGSLTGWFIGLNYSRVKVLNLINGSISGSGRSGRWNYSIMVMHFTIFIVLVSMVIALSRQIKYSMSGYTGIHPENVLVVQLNTNELKKNFTAICSEVEQLPGVMKTAGGSFIPPFGNYLPINLATAEGERVRFDGLIMGEGMVELLGIEVTDGTSFGPYKPGPPEILLNESSAVKYNVMAGEMFMNVFKVRGVVKDFHAHSLHTLIQPMVILQKNPDRMGLLAIKTNGTNDEAVIKKLRELYSRISPDEFFEVNYLTDDVSSFYSRERNHARIIGAFSALATILSVMGLFGISLFSIARRRKEIGIRKVNGATIPEVLIMLNADFLKWVILSIIIAVPSSIYLINKWLERFAYKTEVNWWIFAAAGFSAILIAVLTVSWQSLRAATRNPVEALRYE